MKKFVQLDLLDNSMETKGFVIEFVFSNGLNYM